jgi:mono/diheme cytochrome c family protein
MLNTFRTELVTLLVVFFTTGLLLAACSPPTGNAENGQRWFTMHNCSGCHGKNANDGRAPKIAAIDRGFGSFVRFLRSPGSASMPSFPEETLSKQDAADIYTWLNSLPE